MARRPLKSLMQGRLARWLEHVSALLSRQAERWTAAAPGREIAGSPADDEATTVEEGNPGSTGGSPEGPPAHWLARLQQSGQPLRWIEHRGGPMPTRPPGRRPPRAGTRDPGVSQPNPPQGKPPAVSQPRPRAGAAPPAEDLPDASSPQQQDRTQVEEATERRLLPHPRATRAVERPARLVPRPGPAEKADPGAPADQAPRPQFRLQPHLIEGPASHPPGQAEATEATSGHEEKGRTARRTERRPAMAVTPSEPHPEETPAVHRPPLPRWPSPQASRPRSTTPVWSTGPMGDEGQTVESHPLGPQSVEIPRLDDGVEASAQSNWPVLDADRPGHENRADRAVETAARMAGMALNEHYGESVRLRAHPATPTADKDAARARQTGERQLWDEQPPADRWPSLPESSYPGNEASEALTEETWNAHLSAWQRLRRLDEEQGGKPWSA